jgi:hypothetical protein
MYVKPIAKEQENNFEAKNISFFIDDFIFLVKHIFVNSFQIK